MAIGEQKLSPSNNREGKQSLIDLRQLQGSGFMSSESWKDSKKMQGRAGIVTQQ